MDITQTTITNTLYISAVDYGDPSAVANIVISVGNTHYGSIRRLACSKDFITEGSEFTITCQENESWSTSKIICTRSCGNPPAVSYATVKIGNTTVGQQREYVCDLGTTPSNNTIVCQPDGVWSTIDLQCYRPCSK